MSLNDPQWGRRPGQGPPDLDELWRDFNRRLNGLFGRRGGGGDGNDAPEPRRWGGGAGLLLILIVAVWLASGFYIVYEGQRGIVLRFGKLSETTQPGPRWKSSTSPRSGRWRSATATTSRARSRRNR
jgi:membrane protease subunit HflK